jgi:hypothetical protein
MPSRRQARHESQDRLKDERSRLKRVLPRFRMSPSMLRANWPTVNGEASTEIADAEQPEGFLVRNACIELFQQMVEHRVWRGDAGKEGGG